jgi:hypothetical protein
MLGYNFFRLAPTNLSEVFWIVTGDPALLTLAEAAGRLRMLWEKAIQEPLPRVKMVKPLGQLQGSNQIRSQIG